MEVESSMEYALEYDTRRRCTALGLLQALTVVYVLSSKQCTVLLLNETKSWISRPRL